MSVSVYVCICMCISVYVCVYIYMFLYISVWAVGLQNLDFVKPTIDSDIYQQLRISTLNHRFSTQLKYRFYKPEILIYLV